jgi:hypothetical protein
MAEEPASDVKHLQHRAEAPLTTCLQVNLRLVYVASKCSALRRVMSSPTAMLEVETAHRTRTQQSKRSPQAFRDRGGRRVIVELLVQ